MRRSAAILNDAFARLAEEPFVGRSERDLVWRMAELMHEGGADDAAFSTAVGAGRDGRLAARGAGRPPHRGGGDGRRRRRLPRQRLLLGLHADVRRRGRCPPSSQEAYDVVLRAQLASLEAVVPGAEGKAVDRVARSIIEEAGLRRPLRPRPRSRRRAGGARGAVAQSRAGESTARLPATSSPSSPASTSRVSAASASRTS